MRVRYPRTPHLPWSPGASSDDVRLADLRNFEGREVVVTEKMDGENTTLYSDGLHARSLDSAHHPSRAWVKALHGRIASLIPEGWRICGENVFARHSVAYQDLESWFYAFSVWDQENRCLDWDSTVRFTRRLGIPLPPVLYRGVFDEKALRALRLDLKRQEGYVVRSVAGFSRDDFQQNVGKWVRAGHVQTDEHWMLAAVVENGRSSKSALWDLRSGGKIDTAGLCAALGPFGASLERPELEAAETVLAAMTPRLEALPRLGESRLIGILAALLHGRNRFQLMTELPPLLGIPTTRRIADQIGLQSLLQQPFPDASRRAGLIRLARAADLGILHALAGAVLAGRKDPESQAARDQIEWSEMHAAEAGLLVENPFTDFRAELTRALPGFDPDIADRCWAEALDAYGEGRIHTPQEAAAATWRWRDGKFPRLFLLVGPSGSGKSHHTSRYFKGLPVVALDDLRAARGSRASQKDNAEVLREGLDLLEDHLAAGRTVVWDATGLNRQQRSLPLAAALRRDALVTAVVFLVPWAVLQQRNAERQNSVPGEVLATQLQRAAPPFPGELHRIRYVDAEGRIGEVAGSLSEEEI